MYLSFRVYLALQRLYLNYRRGNRKTQYCKQYRA
nr:MAG TPA: hypothetical protein [Caudoviricetes sp.]